MELTPNQMVDALRKCGGTLVCDGCPYQELGTARCIQTMQQDAAAMIEGMDVIIQTHDRTIEALRDFAKGGLK
jgi:hypothetical protein